MEVTLSVTEMFKCKNIHTTVVMIKTDKYDHVFFKKKNRAVTMRVQQNQLKQTTVYPRCFWFYLMTQNTLG